MTPAGSSLQQPFLFNFIFKDEQLETDNSICQYCQVQVQGLDYLKSRFNDYINYNNATKFVPF